MPTGADAKPSVTAIACMAYDTDMPIEVESEYLPKYLLQRTWVGEFPT